MNIKYSSPDIILINLSIQDLIMSSTPEIVVHNDSSDEEVDGTQVLARQNHFEWDDEEE